MSREQVLASKEWILHSLAMQAASLSVRIDEAEWHDSVEGFTHGYSLLRLTVNGSLRKRKFSEKILENLLDSAEHRAFVLSILHGLISQPNHLNE